MILYQLLYRQLPFKNIEDVDILQRDIESFNVLELPPLNEENVSRDQFSLKLQKIIKGCLQKEPSARLKIEEIVAVLERDSVEELGKAQSLADVSFNETSIFSFLFILKVILSLYLIVHLYIFNIPISSVFLWPLP